MLCRMDSIFRPNLQKLYDFVGEVFLRPFKMKILLHCQLTKCSWQLRTSNIYINKKSSRNSTNPKIYQFVEFGFVV